MVVVFLVDTLVYSTYISRVVVLARVDEVGGETVCTLLLPPKCETRIAPPLFGRACYKHTRTSYETHSGTQLTATRLDMYVYGIVHTIFS